MHWKKHSQQTPTFGCNRGSCYNTVLSQDYLNKRHTIFVGNRYSPKLFSVLHENGTNAFGIVQKKPQEQATKERKIEKR